MVKKIGPIIGMAERTGIEKLGSRETAPALLKPSGRIMLELGDEQAAPARQIFETQKWIVEAVRPDYTQRLRILIARWE